MGDSVLQRGRLEGVSVVSLITLNSHVSLDVQFRLKKIYFIPWVPCDLCG
jgi:hypothetical protein